MDEVLKPGYIRVSEVLRIYNDFSMIPKEVFAHKTDVGSRVHDAIYLYNECIAQTQDLKPEEQGYFDSYLLWNKEFNVQTPYNEKRLYDDYFMITGKIDGLVKFPYEGKLVLADWKTTFSYNKHTAKIWEAQGTMYHYLVTKNGHEDLADRFLFIQLDPDGKMPKIREYQFSPDIMAKCAEAIDAYHHFMS